VNDLAGYVLPMGHCLASDKPACGRGKK